MLKIIDLEAIPKHFDAAELEMKWDQIWETLKINDYDETRSREETFVVDTPPPTVSGSLHMGHVFSYTQTDVVVRYQRMCGKNIFYPMGWDDNGLPTERRVQNYFNVQCDLTVAYDPSLQIEPMGMGAPRLIARQNFIELCYRLTQEDEKVFKALWKRMGLSVDWKQEYTTIDPHCRSMAQLSFLDLYKKGHVYSKEAPAMWDVDFQTAVAQAEVEDRSVSGAFHRIAFGLENSHQTVVIATTRPELLPACVGITAHPDDVRYQSLFGQCAISPLFQVPVPIFPSSWVDPAKGTGILMVCTFGDAMDVQWWREQQLPLRQIFGKNGRLLPIVFGEGHWTSLDPVLANQAYSFLVGKTVKQAQKNIVDLLRDETYSAQKGSGPALQGEPEPILHAVKYFEKGDRPLEYISTRQWYVRLLDQKDALLKKGEEIVWYPEFMKSRFRNWTEHLQLDWGISRQRYFGVPFPVWYPLDSEGIPDYQNPIFPDLEALPIDPLQHCPKGFSEKQRNQPQGFMAETDVFDTWFTSSLTPQISSQWRKNDQRHAQLFPADLRPQSHEIIRTWAFYTIVKALLHEDQIPWRRIAVSGWILDPDRKKMSKSKGNVVTPAHLIEQYSADSVRYWAASAKLGVDTAFDPEVFRVGRRLVTKLYNAAKFVLSQKADLGEITQELDRAWIQQLRNLIQTVTIAFEHYDYARALLETERFFWTRFTDTYIELVKIRAWGETQTGVLGQASAVATLRLGLNVLLRLLAPFLPYMTEEIWSWCFAQETKTQSLHRAPWPSLSELSLIAPPKIEDGYDFAVECLSKLHQYKTSQGLSNSQKIAFLQVRMRALTELGMQELWSDVMVAGRIERYRIDVSDQEGVEIVQVELV